MSVDQIPPFVSMLTQTIHSSYPSMASRLLSPPPPSKRYRHTWNQKISSCWIFLFKRTDWTRQWHRTFSTVVGLKFLATSMFYILGYFWCWPHNLWHWLSLYLSIPSPISQHFTPSQRYCARRGHPTDCHWWNSLAFSLSRCILHSWPNSNIYQRWQFIRSLSVFHLSSFGFKQTMECKPLPMPNSSHWRSQKFGRGRRTCHQLMSFGVDMPKFIKPVRVTVDTSNSSELRELAVRILQHFIQLATDP